MSAALDEVKSFIDIETLAISRAKGRLEAATIDKVVQLLATCPGKLILTGVGKSAIIAAKLAATFTSTGTAAVHLHAADAAHGDLGIVSANDVVIVLSHSGETDEILLLLPHLKKRGVKLIGILGNMASTIAKNVDFVIDASIEKEACPLNLAPTASTTVALALGDAVAMAVLKAKGYGSSDFAQNHPAGRLGKRLTLTVKDLMNSTGPNPLVSSEALLPAILSAISRGGLGAVNVVDKANSLLGIITDGDIRRAVEKYEDVRTRKADQIMTKHPVAIAAGAMAIEALDLMEKRNSQISVLPVLESGQCVGMIRLHDIVRAGL